MCADLKLDFDSIDKFSTRRATTVTEPENDPQAPLASDIILVHKNPKSERIVPIFKNVITKLNGWNTLLKFVRKSV